MQRMSHRAFDPVASRGEGIPEREKKRYRKNVTRTRREDERLVTGWGRLAGLLSPTGRVWTNRDRISII